MAITSISQQRFDTMTLVTVTSDLSGTVYYHWYLDGEYLGVTTDGTKSINMPAGEQGRIEITDTNDPDYDGAGNTPTAYPATRTLTWMRSTDDSVERYRVEQKKGAGDYEPIATLTRAGAQWLYSVVTPRLVDLSTYDWQIVPIDGVGNDGTVKGLDAEDVVRTPDAPDFTISFDSGTTKVTFTGVS